MADNGAFRWLVTATYKTDSGPTEIDWHIEELGDIEGFVERGPDWNTLIDIRVRLNPKRRSYDDTVEQSELR